VRAHEEQNDVSEVNSVVNVASPFVTSRDHAVMPFDDLAEALPYYELQSDHVHE
jgi:hypothetical protein